MCLNALSVIMSLRIDDGANKTLKTKEKKN